MPDPGAPTQPRWTAEDAFLELLTDTLETMERPARGQFLQRFFRSIAQVDLTEALALDLWEQSLARRRELSESIGKRVALQAALVDVLASANLLRLPILMEYEELRKLQINAATDPLTSLYNRRFFDDYFEKELNRSIRYSHRLALVIFDLHRFKEVNDRYGHPQGDVLLQMAAATLRKSLRTSDYAFRIGGDEFALLLPQTETEQATALSRRLRAAYGASVERLNLGIQTALDFGLAVYPEDGELQEVLIRVADSRLYQLKNGVTLSSPVPPTPAVPPATIPPSSTPSSSTPPTGKPLSGMPLSGIPSMSAPSGPPSAFADRQDISSALKAGNNPSEQSSAKNPETDRRRWERVSLAATRAYAFIGEGVERTARVIDLGYGGVALETSRPDELGESFHAVLHVPILPPVRVSLRRIYQGQGNGGAARIGCSFVT